MKMKHAYLTKEEIDRSYLRGAITMREVKELLDKLDGRVSTVVNRRNVERHGRVKLHKLV